MKKGLVLVLNCGSSSVKFAVVDPLSGDSNLSGLIQRINSPDSNLKYRYHTQTTTQDLPQISYQDAIRTVTEIVLALPEIADHIVAIGHRVLHGGSKFTQSVIIDPEVLQTIRDCIPLGPLHNPAQIVGIEGTLAAFPTMPQIAVFDTAFHQTMPEHAYIYPIPYRLYTDHQIRRYGFHGTSHRFVAQQAAQELKRPLNELALITAHLGNGCSVAAILNGQSVDTSMGMTPLEGLVMGTRSGDIDPSLHLYLAQNLGYDLTQITEMLNKESGMLGVSQLDSDLRTIEDAVVQGNRQATLALEIFCYRLAKYIASYTVPIGRLDALVFTGGIGENSPIVRAKTLEWLKIFNFYLDTERNEQTIRGKQGVITTDSSPLIAMVIPTNEELMIAQDAIELCAPKI